jgi:hypothetical protein
LEIQSNSIKSNLNIVEFTLGPKAQATIGQREGSVLFTLSTFQADFWKFGDFNMWCLAQPTTFYTSHFSTASTLCLHE